MNVPAFMEVPPAAPRAFVVFATLSLPAFARTLWPFSTRTLLTFAGALRAFPAGTRLATAGARRIPRQQVGAIGVHPRRKLSVEDEVPGRIELRDIRQDAPAHEQIPVAGCL